MPGQPGSEASLTAESREAVWRIFGAGAAPGTPGSAFDNIDAVVREHVPAADQDCAIVTIASWFDSGTHVHWLRAECAEPVAELVLAGVGPRRSEDAIWAIASIGLDLSVGMLRRRWSEGEITSFIEAAVNTLNGVQARTPGDAHGAGAEDGEFSGFHEAVSQDGFVGAFTRLEKHSLELVNQGLHPAVANLIDLAVALSPEPSPLLITRLEAPTMQARAARRLVARGASSDPGVAAGWIGGDASDAAVALAIMHTLSAIRSLDEGRLVWENPAARAGKRDDAAGGEARPLEDVAANLVHKLLDRLGSLDPSLCLRWLGELLNQASPALSAPGDGEKPPRLTQLEQACTRLAVGLFAEFESADLLLSFQAGLRPGRRRPWVRHQMVIARAMHELATERAEQLARATVDEHRRQVAEQQDGYYLAHEWNDWRDREWLEGLGTALALMSEDLDLPTWVAEECRGLPLTVWDAEEDPDGFAVAEQVAQHWFVVALLAIPQRSAFGRPFDRAAVCALAEAVWAHCRFCRQHLETHPEASIAAELAARYAMRYGQADDQWTLDQARGEGVGPRALCVLLEERRARTTPTLEENPDYDDMIVAELARIAAERFADGGQFDLETLQYWGQLWLALGAVDEAERTALAIVSFPLRATDRQYRILALKLLGLVARHRKPRQEVTDFVVPLYNQLWPVFGGTPTQEAEDRQEIERAFGNSNLIAR